MKRVIRYLLFGIVLGCAMFAVIGIFFDITNKGSFVLTNWAYTKMVLGAMLVGIGFSLPSQIYENEKLHYAVKVMIHLGIGCAVMVTVAFAVGWVSPSLGWKVCALAIGGYLISAFIIWLLFSLYFKREAKKLNEKIRQGQHEN